MASSSTDPKQLDEVANGILRARNFFWDSVILYLGSSILALTGFDAVSEYIRGSGVSCIDSEGQDTGVGYVTSYCGDSLPSTQYLPAFLYLHALAIIIPHFVFNATFGGEFDYFFSVAQNLNTDNGKFSKTNIRIVRRLTSSFTVTRSVTTYGKNSIYLIYLGKLLLQLLFAIGSLTVSVIYFTDFNVSLPCPKDETKLNTTAFPHAKQLTCVYNSLKLLYYIRIVDLSLIVLICSAVVRGLWYCISSHPFRLQPEKVAKFTYQSSIHPDRHSDNCGLFCQKRLCCHLFSPFGLPRIFVTPMIASDLDFLVLKLFRTNAGIGKLFRDIQIELEIRDKFDQERMTLKLYKYKFNSHFKGMDIPDCDLKWRFTSKAKPTATCPHDLANSTFLSLTVPNTIRGTILGLSYYAPNCLAALVITFNSCGYGLALQRRFAKVSTIEFINARAMEADVVSTNTSNPNLKLKDLVKFVKTTSSDTEVVVSENALVSIELETQDSNPKLKNMVKFMKTRSTDTEVVVSENALVELETNDFIEYLSPLWKYETESLKTSFLVIGPMNEKQAHLMSLLLTQMSSTSNFLEDNCLIVSMVPKRIGTAQISRGYFKGLNKTPHNCTEATVCLNVSQTPPTWPPSWPPSTERQSPNPNYLEEESDIADLERSRLLNETYDSQNKVNLLCGETDVEFEIHTYRFKYEDTIDERMIDPAAG